MYLKRNDSVLISINQQKKNKQKFSGYLCFSGVELHLTTAALVTFDMRINMSERGVRF